MNRKQLRASLLLLLAAAIWGVSFVAQRMVVGLLEPFTFNCLRCFVGALALMPFAFRSLRREERDYGEQAPARRKKLLIGGLVCGVLLFLATNCQQLGIEETDSGKSAFITALYIVLVPLFGLVSRRLPKPHVWLGIAFSVIGLYLLCAISGFTFRLADLVLMLCALFFAGQILAVDAYAPKVNCLALSCIQFLTAGFLSLIFMFVMEKPSWGAIWQGILPILYSGILSSGIAYTLQIIGQRDSDPTVASLIMCLEGVFAALAGFVILGETLTTRELIGCGLMLMGIVLSQLPGKPATSHETSSLPPS